MLVPSAGSLRVRNCASSARQRIEAAIERHTRISRDHLTPELRLHLLTPDCSLYGARQPEGAVEHFREPFWAIYWPGGQALARYLLDEGRRILGERARLGGRALGTVKVLDVGAGCGAAAIAAKLAGAGDVLANDIDEVACVAAAKNARLNGLDIRTTSEDLLDAELPEPFDFVLVGDLFYDEAMAGRLEAWLEDRVLATGAEVYLADPGRHGLTAGLRRKLAPLRAYRLTESARLENRGFDEAAVWKFLGRRGRPRA